MRSTAAERRKTLATAEGRGFAFRPNEPRGGERIFRRSATRLISNFLNTSLQPWLGSYAAPRHKTAQ
jgi:hypothetical protein